jgi:hypothetical protein
VANSVPRDVKDVKGYLDRLSSSTNTSTRDLVTQLRSVISKVQRGDTSLMTVDEIDRAYDSLEYPQDTTTAAIPATEKNLLMQCMQGLKATLRNQEVRADPMANSSAGPSEQEAYTYIETAYSWYGGDGSS